MPILPHWLSDATGPFSSSSSAPQPVSRTLPSFRLPRAVGFPNFRSSPIPSLARRLDVGDTYLVPTSYNYQTLSGPQLGGVIAGVGFGFFFLLYLLYWLFISVDRPSQNTPNNSKRVSVEVIDETGQRRLSYGSGHQIVIEGSMSPGSPPMHEYPAGGRGSYHIPQPGAVFMQNTMRSIP